MNQKKPLLNNQAFYNRLDWKAVIGAVILVTGLLLLTSQMLRNPVPAIAAPLVAGLLFLGTAYFTQRQGYIVAGSLLAAAGIAVIWIIVRGGFADWQSTASRLVVLLTLGFALIPVLAWIWLGRRVLWPFIPSLMLGSLAAVLLFTQGTFWDFVLFVGVALGVVLLLSGYVTRLIGLIIPGGIVIGLAAGIGFSWGYMHSVKLLAQTGAMLIWFGVGWLLITVFARLAVKQLMWWPLIPGGILAVVGYGLYLGGNPVTAGSIAGNTGSIMLIIFGIYLMLMRRGLRK